MRFALAQSADLSAMVFRDPSDLDAGDTLAQREARQQARTTEQALVVRIREGDVQAFTTMVEQHLNRVTRIAFYLLGSHDAAEDVVQSVFVQLWEHRRALDPDRPLAPYLFRAVRNRALDERKAESVRIRHQEQVQADAVAGSVRSTAPSPEGAVLTTAMVQAALAQLPERRQLALRLWLEEQLTIPEIAHILAVSDQAADRLVRRALADLRALLLVSK